MCRFSEKCCDRMLTNKGLPIFSEKLCSRFHVNFRTPNFTVEGIEILRPILRHASHGIYPVQNAVSSLVLLLFAFACKWGPRIARGM